MASSSSNSYPAPTFSSSQSHPYNVFLSFRGDDARKTFVDHLHAALDDRMISTYKDDDTLHRGEPIRPSLLRAIEESNIAVIIFSKRYGDSSWCLDELSHIMKCKTERNLIVMPIFYGVVPSDVRKQEGKFGEGFAKQGAQNTDQKVETWKKALVDACDIAGWETRNIANGHESKSIKEIVDAISDKLFSLSSFDDESLVGMTTRMEKVKAQLKIGSDGVRMVGIWGVGGSGKTTLVSSLYRNISHHFHRGCIIENVKEESRNHGLKFLQEKVLSKIAKNEHKLENVDGGKVMMKTRLTHNKVLIILDDVDECAQLDALVGSHNWFGGGSRIIITTRDRHVLEAKVDHVCQVELLSNKEAIQLFNSKAYNETKPLKNYMTLSLKVVSYAAGLPLALKVLGSFLYDKDEREWLGSLARLKVIPKTEILKQLKISYDGLETMEKKLFLDIACFFTRNGYFQMKSHEAMEILEACGYHPDIGIKVLRDKALLTITDGEFDMHSLIQEMGQYIVRGEHPNNPKKHNRVWKNEEIRNMCLGDATMENDMIEAIIYYHPPVGHSSHFCKIVSTMKKLRWLSVSLEGDDVNETTEGPSFLSKELQYIYWKNYPKSQFPDNFQPIGLVHLKIFKSLQKEMWRGYKHMPNLKVLHLQNMKNLLNTPDFDGLQCLQKLILKFCKDLKGIHSSLGQHTRIEYIVVYSCPQLRVFPPIDKMVKLNTLVIRECNRSLKFPEIKSNIESLEKLSLSNMVINVLLSSIGERCTNLVSLNLDDCSFIKTEETNFHWRILTQMTHGLRRLVWDEHILIDENIFLHDISELSNLRELSLSRHSFTQLDFNILKFTKLKLLNLNGCERLVKLPKLPTSLVVLRANNCKSLSIDNYQESLKWLCDISFDHTIDGGKLLQFMLQGKAIENHRCMFLHLRGLETARMFMPTLVGVGKTRRLKLPKNWCDNFSGFLLCFVQKDEITEPMKPTRYISIKHTTFKKNKSLQRFDYSNMFININDQDCKDDHKYQTWFLYVPFDSLRCTQWWDERSKCVSFLAPRLIDFCSWYSVRLVSKKSESGPTETSTSQEDSEFSHYAPKLDILDDSQHHLKFWVNKTIM